VLRFSFSEDRAKAVESKHWCGAAKPPMSLCEAKHAFLFQFCTSPPGAPGFARDCQIYRK
jgi:hypothetical protein